MSPCPSDKTLRMLADDVSNPALLSEIDAHLTSCAPCRARLESLAWECRTSTADSSRPLPVVGEFPQIPGFAIQEELGRGSMGVVYRARDLQLGRLVAIKVMPAGPGADQQARKQWRKEGKAFSRVRHPNVVVLHDIGEVGSWFFLVLEYIPGRALKDRLDGPLPREQAARLVATVAEAVHCIHQANVLHLDLKPANILIDGEPGPPLDQVTPKVADFGIARLRADADRGDEASLTTQLSPGGTPSYMAPEQVSGKPDELGPATDIHALGAILYKLLTGRAAFQGASPVETMEQVRHQEPVSPRRLNPNVPRDLETITFKCLEKKPVDRYASAEALAEDLRRWLDGRPIRARPVSRIEQSWRACRRRPDVAIVGAVLAATLAVSFVLLLNLRNRADAQRARAESARDSAEKNRETAEKNREAAEQNLEIASTMIVRFEGVILEAFHGKRPFINDSLDSIVFLLREQVARARATAGFKPDLLLPLSRIDAKDAHRLWAAKRFDEARVLMKEQLDILGECAARDPANELFLWEAVDALYLYSVYERQASRPEEALAYLGEASSMILSTQSVSPDRYRFACLLSKEYFHLSDGCRGRGNPDQSERARLGHDRIFARFRDEPTDRPEQILFKACLLADHGEWERARELIENLQSASFPLHAEPVGYHDSIRHGVMGWFERELRHPVIGGPAQDGWPAASQANADRLTKQLSRLCDTVGIHIRGQADVMMGAVDALATQASVQRSARKLERADDLVSLIMAIAQKMIRTFPEDAGSFRILSEAHLQRHKNAWKRNDFTTVRRELTQSIDAINRAMVLDPDNTTFQALSADRKQRLARLPRA